MKVDKRTVTLGVLSLGVALTACRFLANNQSEVKNATMAESHANRGDKGQESIERCLKRFGLKFADAIYIEEPYGKLAALKFYRPGGGWIELRLSSRSNVVSMNGTWDRDAVLSAPVGQVIDDQEQIKINRRILEEQDNMK